SAYAAIPDGNRKHPAQAVQYVLAPGQIALQDDFGIAATTKDVPLALKLCAQLQKVVNLSIKCKPNLAIGTAHWLVALGRQVDNGEARKAKPGPTVGPDPTVVRSTMIQRRRHCLQPALCKLGLNRLS